MSNNYQVVWAAAAQNDLKQIIDYIAIESPGNASQNPKKNKRKGIRSLCLARSW
uniref:Uncharacterized protein n=1 Tax=uncultured Desulfobacterium sp. TaxID=201089 RepID=E1YD85_9BACT|nr:unknown protein [uncultured Desulfobacterium sp.]